MAIEKNLTLKL